MSNNQFVPQSLFFPPLQIQSDHCSLFPLIDSPSMSSSSALASAVTTATCSSVHSPILSPVELHSDVDIGAVLILPPSMASPSSSSSSSGDNFNVSSNLEPLYLGFRHIATQSPGLSAVAPPASLNTAYIHSPLQHPITTFAPPSTPAPVSYQFTHFAASPSSTLDATGVGLGSLVHSVDCVSISQPPPQPPAAPVSEPISMQPEIIVNDAAATTTMPSAVVPQPLSLPAPVIPAVAPAATAPAPNMKKRGRKSRQEIAMMQAAKEAAVRPERERAEQMDQQASQLHEHLMNTSGTHFPLTRARRSQLTNIIEHDVPPSSSSTHTRSSHHHHQQQQQQQHQRSHQQNVDVISSSTTRSAAPGGSLSTRSLVGSSASSPSSPTTASRTVSFSAASGPTAVVPAISLTSVSDPIAPPPTAPGKRKRGVCADDLHDVSVTRARTYVHRTAPLPLADHAILLSEQVAQTSPSASVTIVDPPQNTTNATMMNYTSAALCSNDEDCFVSNPAAVPSTAVSSAAVSSSSIAASPCLSPSHHAQQPSSSSTSPSSSPWSSPQLSSSASSSSSSQMSYEDLSHRYGLLLAIIRGQQPQQQHQSNDSTHLTTTAQQQPDIAQHGLSPEHFKSMDPDLLVHHLHGIIHDLSAVKATTTTTQHDMEHNNAALRL